MIIISNMTHTLQLVRPNRKFSKIVESQIPVYDTTPTPCPFPSPFSSYSFYIPICRDFLPPLWSTFLCFAFLLLSSALLCPFFFFSSACLDGEKNDWKAETSASWCAQTLSPSNPHCLYVRDCFLGLITIAQSTDTCNHTHSPHTISPSLFSKREHTHTHTNRINTKTRENSLKETHFTVIWVQIF